MLVATSLERLQPGQAQAWDGGKVASPLPIVEYAGEKLANQTTYYWKLRLWGEDGQPGPWSDVQREAELVEIRLEADGPLYMMARIIVGTLVQVGLGVLSPEEVGRILDSRDRRRAGPTAPPQGLSLVKVIY